LLVGAMALDQRAQLVAQWRAPVVLSVSLQTLVVTRVADDLTAAPVIENPRRRCADDRGGASTARQPPGDSSHTSSASPRPP